VLAYQFTAGLLPTLCSKVAGVEGNFEQLLVKACFEEAKLRDILVTPDSLRDTTNQILGFLQVVTRNLTTGLFMAITVRDVSSVMVWATVPRTVPRGIEVFLLRPEGSRHNSHDQVVRMTNSLVGLCQHYKELNQHSGITSLETPSSRHRAE